MATSILVGSGIIGSGLGFVIPTLVVSEENTGQESKDEIFSLYFSYAIIAMVFLLINFVFMKSEPSSSVSNIVEKKEFTIKQTFAHIKADKNLLVLFGCYCLIYGSFQCFASSANLLIKNFGVSDIDIAIAAVFMIVFGSTGAILGSLYLKKYG